MPIISIIVPIFNAEKFLPRCIDSILVQTFTEFELLLIDDGSPDNSGKICEEFAKKDDRIRVYHQSNKGSGIARNVGINLSKGDYLAFIDSDDYVESDYLKSMYDIALRNNADMVISSYFVNTGNIINVKANKPTSLCNKQIALDFIDGKLHAGLWNKLMKRDFVNNNNIRFPEESYYEDMHFTISSLMNGCRVTYLDKATYHYVINTNSLTFNVDIYKRIKSFKEFANNIQNLCLQFNFYEDNDFAFSINKLINSNKKSFISKFYKNKNKTNEILNYIPSYFNYCDIKSFFDFAYYIALKYDIYLLFHLNRIIKSIKLVSII